MSFSWRYETVDGSTAPSEGLTQMNFSTQADAESWIGEHWPQLLDGGVDQVSLLEGDRVVYSAMSLHPAE